MKNKKSLIFAISVLLVVPISVGIVNTNMTQATVNHAKYTSNTSHASSYLS